MAEVFHLGLGRADLKGSTIAILPGDPGRVAKIAASFDDPIPLASTREFSSIVATADGVPLTICSTGIGGPSTSIAVEELAQLGVRTFLRVGTTGAIQPDIAVGDVIVTTGSVRLDGASAHFAPPEFPAVADFECTRALVEAGRGLGVPLHVGITASSDTFYPGQERYDTVGGFVRDRFRGSLAEWRQLGVLNYEMESATLFTQCATSGFRAGMVAGVLVNRTEDEIPRADAAEIAESRAIAVVAEAVRLLIGSLPARP